MKILGIETSCDDTAVAVLEEKNGKIKVLSNIVSSQVKLHAKYGGVFPALAAREHAKNIDKVLKLSLREAGLKSVKDVDLIAVTHGPGLLVSLVIGIAFAKTLAWKYRKPLIGVNHLEGHIYSNWLKPVGEFSILNYKFSNKKLFPALNLIVSGGHTELVLMSNHGKYKIVGETLDDAVGEAFDKVARLLGLSYPGGPAISARAEKFSVSNFQFPIKFPRPMEKSKNFDFSYSGLKTSVLYKLRDLKTAGIKITDVVINEICYEFQKAAIDVLVFKTMKAVEKYKPRSLLLSGGVSANNLLREKLEEETSKLKYLKFYKPHMSYTTDNAAMIALAGYFRYKKIRRTADAKNSWRDVVLRANWKLG